MPADWWMSGRYRSPSSQGRNAYLLFMLREFTSIVLAIFLVFYLVQIARLGAGQAAYDAFLDSLRSPGMLFLHLLALVAAVYHTITWLQLAGIVMVLRGVPPRALVLGGYVAWAVASLVVFVFVALYFIE
jgi:fumarate reductase subunit C